MITEYFSNSHGLDCNGSVRIRCIDLGDPSAANDLEQVLLDHVMDCHTCLAVALLSEDSLAKSGCPTYRSLLDSFSTKLRRVRHGRQRSR